MKIRCLIVDDEKTARDGLRLLCEAIDELEVVGAARNGMEAIDNINALKPQLILLDIQMQGLNGFEVLKNITTPPPQIIFITAHDQFAIKAFEVNAVDYLLKPFSDSRFNEAVAKAIKQIKLAASQNISGLLISGVNQEEGNTIENHVVFKEDGNVYRINESSIQYIEAFDYYVKIHTKDRHYLVRDTMKNMQKSLNDELFLRIHKSYIVNIRYITSLNHNSSSGYELIMVDQKHLRVSRNMIKKVREWIR